MKVKLKNSKYIPSLTNTCKDMNKNLKIKIVYAIVNKIFMSAKSVKKNIIIQKYTNNAPKLILNV